MFKPRQEWASGPASPYVVSGAFNEQESHFEDGISSSGFDFPQPARLVLRSATPRISYQPVGPAPGHFLGRCVIGPTVVCSAIKARTLTTTFSRISVEDRRTIRPSGAAATRS